MIRRAAVLVAAALCFAGCDEAKPPPKPVAAAPEKPKVPLSTRPLTPAWPIAVQGKTDQAQMSADLFARNYYVVLDASGSMTERQPVRSPRGVYDRAERRNRPERTAR